MPKLLRAMLRDEGQDNVQYALVIALVYLAAVVLVGGVSSAIKHEYSKIRPMLEQSPGKRQVGPKLSAGDENRLQDCVKLVEGQILFQPNAVMRQGRTYPIFARITRDTRVNIARGLNASGLRIESAKVSCDVRMQVRSEEPDAFTVDPPGEVEHFVLANDYAQWDWNVTPRKFGELHLELVVIPRLRIPNLNGWVDLSHSEPPREIAVNVAYQYELGYLARTYWPIWTSLFLLVVGTVNVILAIRSRRQKNAKEKEPKGFAQK